MQKNLASLSAKHLLVERAARKIFGGQEGTPTSRMVVVKDFSALYALAHEYDAWLHMDGYIPRSGHLPPCWLRTPRWSPNSGALTITAAFSLLMFLALARARAKKIAGSPRIIQARLSQRLPRNSPQARRPGQYWRQKCRQKKCQKNHPTESTNHPRGMRERKIRAIRLHLLRNKR